MTNSRKKVGPFVVRPQVRDGMPTGKYVLDIPATLTGTGKRKRKLFDNRRTALEVAKGLTRRLDPVTGQLLPITPAAGVSFRQAVAMWRNDEQLRVETNKKRASTLEVDLYRLRSLKRFLGDDDIAAISERRLAEYQRWRLKQGRSPRTINSDLGTFSLVMKWAMKQGYVSEVPKVEQIPVERTLTVIPKPEEVVRILEALPSNRNYS